MRSIVAAAALLAAPACASTPPGEPAAACDASKAQSLIGQPASDSLSAKAKRLAGAGMVRNLVPGQIVTMEYRADRLNIVLDAQNKVTAIRCG